MSKRPTYATQIAPHHAVEADAGVPSIVTLPYETRQGDQLAETGQTVVQYYTGNGFQHYVALLDFEDWGDERCPRFAIYAAVCGQSNGWVYDLAADVAERLVWPGEAR